jgi:hypothetical protein
MEYSYETSSVPPFASPRTLALAELDARLSNNHPRGLPSVISRLEFEFDARSLL